MSRPASLTLLLGSGVAFAVAAAAEPGPDPAPAGEAVAESSEVTGFHGGGGLFVLPTFVELGGGWHRWGVWIGGGGFAYVWRDWLRIGGMGAEAFFGSADDWEYRLNYGGFFADWVFHPYAWLEIPLGVEFGFGSGRFEKNAGEAPEPGARPGAQLVERTSGFAFLVTSSIGLGFIPLSWLKIALIGRVTYLDWLPDTGWAAGGGVSVFFGRFRPETG